MVLRLPLFLACLTLPWFSGCVLTDLGGKTFKEGRNVSVAHVPGKPISVETINGSVSIKQGNVQDVEIVATLKARTEERLAQTKIVSTRNHEDALEVSVVWPDKRLSNEGCSFEIVVPDVSRVKVRTSNGNISLEQLTGDADLKSSNGKISVEKHFGSVLARSSNGRIETKDIAGNIDADTSNGKIKVVRAAGTVKAETSNGSVEVSLLEGNTEPFEVKTSNGSVNVEVGLEFEGQVNLKTSNASIKTSLQNANVIESKKREQTIQFGESDFKSKIRTSNGSITFTQLSSETSHVEENQVIN